MEAQRSSGSKLASSKKTAEQTRKMMSSVRALLSSLDDVVQDIEYAVKRRVDDKKVGRASNVKITMAKGLAIRVAITAPIGEKNTASVVTKKFCVDLSRRNDGLAPPTMIKIIKFYIDPEKKRLSMVADSLFSEDQDGFFASVHAFFEKNPEATNYEDDHLLFVSLASYLYNQGRDEKNSVFAMLLDVFYRHPEKDPILNCMAAHFRSHGHEAPPAHDLVSVEE